MKTKWLFGLSFKTGFSMYPISLTQDDLCPHVQHKSPQSHETNYTTPVGTIEQVMDRVTLALDVQLEKYTKKLMDHMDNKLEEVVETIFASMLETKLNHALDQITHLATSNEPQLHPHFLGPDLTTSDNISKRGGASPLNCEKQMQVDCPETPPSGSPSIFKTPLRGALSQLGCKERRFSTIQSPDAKRSSQQVPKPQQVWDYNTMENDGKHGNSADNEMDDDDCSDIYVRGPISGDIFFGSQARNMEELPISQPLASFHIQDPPISLAPPFGADEHNEDWFPSAHMDVDNSESGEVTPMEIMSEYINELAFQPLIPVLTSGDSINSTGLAIQCPLSAPNSVANPLYESGTELEARALHLLRKYTNKPNAQWTSSLQWQAIAQVYQREEDIIVITATGSGKTMITNANLMA
ncbi:hypothetical protein BYT27DRAFT_7254591 [Phlegmacium glaucopus]|nr:hypothetical protein BYT27DRAFT_7254591 [Phlegmacium glaucopus]